MHNAQLNFYNQRTALFAEFLHQNGYDKNVTVRDMIAFFHGRPGVDTDLFKGNPRGVFHETMHGLANAFDGSGASEASATVFENIFMRGGFGRLNKSDQSLFGETEPITERSSTDRSHTQSVLLISNANAHFSVLQAKQLQTAAALENRAIKDEAFFRALTGGRALYQLSSSELLDLPITCLGIFKAENPNDPEGINSFVTEPIPESIRQAALQAVNMKTYGHPGVSL